MSRSRGGQRRSGDAPSESSSASSPERAAFDDNDSFTAQPNDSQSSIGISTFREMSVSQETERERRQRPPISWLPAELLIAIFSKLSSPADLRNCMLVSKTWAENSVELLWHRPLCNSWKNLLNVVHSIRKQKSYFKYAELVKRLNLTTLATEVGDGTIMPLAGCNRIERLTLANCKSLSDTGVLPLIEDNQSLLALEFTGLELITNITLNTVATNCPRLQGLNVSGCTQLTDDSLSCIARNCRSLKRVGPIFLPPFRSCSPQPL